jgi:hypothetical protein
VKSQRFACKAGSSVGRDFRMVGSILEYAVFIGPVSPQIGNLFLCKGLAGPSMPLLEIAQLPVFWCNARSSPVVHRSRCFSRDGGLEIFFFLVAG